MKKELITQLHHDFESVVQNSESVEFWYARDLQKLLGYEKWENFVKVIGKAKESCLNSGQNVEDHFPDVREMIDIGKGGPKEYLS